MIVTRLANWAETRIQRKLVLALGIPLVLVSALFLVLVSAIYRHQLISVHARAASQINELMQGTLENAMLKRDIPGLMAILEGVGGQDDIARVMILNPEFEVRFSTDPDRVGTVLDNADTARALTERTTRTRYLAETGQGGTETVLRSVNPVLNRDECRACHDEKETHPVNGLLVVDYRADRIRGEALGGAFGLAVLGLLATTLASSAMWVALRRMVLRPLAQLTRANDALGRGEMRTRIAVRGRDEMAGLGRAFNQMSQEISHHLDTISRSEADLQALIDAVPDGLRVIGPDFRIRHANRAFCEQVGQSPEQVLGAPCHAVSHGRDTPCPHTLVTCPVVELIEKGGRAVTFRDRHFTAAPDGKAHVVEVSSARITLREDGAELPCVLEAIRDLDVQARISQEERLSEIGLLAAGVAHEIYNPLSSVGFLLSEIERRAMPVEAGPETEHFDAIRAEIAKCIEITDNLLLLSAPPGEGRTLVEFERVVHGVLSLLNYQAGQGAIAVRVALEPGLRVIASDSDLRMLLTNLLLNAFHAMPGGGQVLVRGWRAGHEVHLAIADTGVGIAPVDLERIFMPFWSRRADSSSGRGLGLSIVRAILERQKARIVVDSRLGAGSTFTVSFPDPDAPDPVQDTPGNPKHPPHDAS
ncbi:MAG: HAMP domain-containing protein [Rhodobacteraceae bacterium]|nr:HAMP domain-containing protein [Paracoccaceae bacterium]